MLHAMHPHMDREISHHHCHVARRRSARAVHIPGPPAQRPRSHTDGTTTSPIDRDELARFEPAWPRSSSNATRNGKEGMTTEHGEHDERSDAPPTNHPITPEGLPCPPGPRPRPKVPISVRHLQPHCHRRSRLAKHQSRSATSRSPSPPPPWLAPRLPRPTSPSHTTTRPESSRQSS